MSSVLRPVRQRKKGRTLGPVNGIVRLIRLVTLVFTARAAKGAPDAAEEFCRQAPRAVRNRRPSYAIELTFGNSDWASLEQPLGKFLAAVMEGWTRASSHPNEMAQE